MSGSLYAQVQRLIVTSKPHPAGRSDESEDSPSLLNMAKSGLEIDGFLGGSRRCDHLSRKWRRVLAESPQRAPTRIPQPRGRLR